MIKVRTMTAAFLFNKEAVLMLKRSENKKIAPGQWACIGGHVESDEHHNLGAIRFHSRHVWA